MGWSLLGEKDTNIVGHIRTSLGHFPLGHIPPDIPPPGQFLSPPWTLPSV